MIRYIILTIAFANFASLQLRAEEFKVTEWANDPLLTNSVGISMDDKGRAYLTVSKRRKQSSLDIRHHQDLVKQDLSFETVDERRNYYRDKLTGKSWIPDRNNDGKKDWKDLTVQKDMVYQVTDKDGDGSADGLKVLGEYHSEVTGIAGGVLAVGDDVFVAAEPDFFRYHDTDGDGFPEKEQLVGTGFQVHMGQGGHNLSGVAVGPDGRVYWSLGDKGHYVKTKEGKTFHMPNSGAIFRCELDGTRVDRFSSGERNAQELAFDSYGNLFSMDNDGDYPGEKERALYITEGSEHGWRLNWQWLRKQDFTKISGVSAYNPWMEEKLFLPDREDHAAYITPTIGNFGPGPCGFTSNPGTALTKELADCFFMTNQQNQVRVFKFLPKGASFKFEELQPIKGGIGNTGLAIGPDGALYSASWGSGKGFIFRFDAAAKESHHPAREETRKILRLISKKQNIKTLSSWLDSPDQRVRMKGQFELVNRGDEGLEALKQKLDSGTLLGKLHAIWGIGMASRNDPEKISLLSSAWKSKEPEILAQAAKVAGDLGQRSKKFNSELIAGLDHESERVKFFCAIALGNRKSEGISEKLVHLIEQSGSKDPYIRHAGSMGLSGTMNPTQIAKLSENPNKMVKLAAIVAMRRVAAPEIRSFLNDSDELILLEAARAIHDDKSISEALPDLAAVLKRKGLKNEALIRRAINAALRTGSGSDLDLLANYIKSGEGSAKMRRTALASMLWWANPPVLDPVEGRYRKHAPRDKDLVNKAIESIRNNILADNELTEVLLKGVEVREESAWLKGTKKYFADWPPKMQVRLLAALAKTNSSELKEFVIQGLDSNSSEVREKARAFANKAGVPTLNLILATLGDPKASGQGEAIRQLANLEDPKAKEKFMELVAEFKSGKTPPHWKLEMWQVAKSKGIKLKGGYELLETGGDPDRGKKLVMEHAAAQCIRCHKINKVGSDLGPDLTKIGRLRNRTHLVISMLDPLREISDGYGNILIKTKSGEEIIGILSSKKTKEWVITLADGSKKKIDPTTVDTTQVISIMPPMSAIMKPEEIRDVVSYLATLK
ncbi:MAG: c-type cytochrome [Verrucomicrobiales bacterium]|nr:c-type cytochrome [Verrucomicrobiales bacterium]